jgi:surface protein
LVQEHKQSGDLSLQDVVNTYSATTFYNMFYNNTSLTVPPKMNFSNVTHIHGMLQLCANLGPNLDMGYYDLSNVIDMHYCFYSCSKLKTIDFSKTDTSKVKNWEGVFKNCTQLEEIIGALDLSSATKVFDMLTATHLYTNPVHFKNVPRRLSLDVGNTYYVVDNYID